MDRLEAKIMPQQVCAINTIVPFEYLRKHHNFSDPDLEKLINHTLSSMEEKDSDSAVHIRDIKDDKVKKPSLKEAIDENYWFSNKFFITLYETLENRGLESDIAYNMGLESIKLDPVQKSGFGISTLGLRYVLGFGSVQMKKWNRTKSMKVEKIKSGNIRITLEHEPGILVNKFAMDYHKGIFEAYARLIGYENIGVKFEKIANPEKEIYEFNITFKEMSLRQRWKHYLRSKDPYLKRIIADNDNARLQLQQQILDQQKIIDTKTSELQAAQQELLREAVAKARKDTELALEKSLSGGLAHEARNSLQPGAFQIQSLAKI